MLPELKFKVAFPGFGSIELEGHSNGNQNTLNEVSIKFVPNTPCKNQNGWLIKLSRNGDCFVQEMKPLLAEEEFEGIGVA
jgi:hypothetical protein